MYKVLKKAYMISKRVLLDRRGIDRYYIGVKMKHLMHLRDKCSRCGGYMGDWKKAEKHKWKICECDTNHLNKGSHSGGQFTKTQSDYRGGYE